MANPRYEPGKFCWMELATSDQKAAREFYGKLFGWKPVEFPMGEMGVYVMLQKDGKDAAAMYENKQVPPNWLTYVSVVSADETAEKAKGLGANIVAGPMDVFTFGRMAVIADPEGAVFALWQPKEHMGAQIAGEVGTLCWDELQTRNAAGAVSFYKSLFGWNIKENPEYNEIHLGQEPIGGIFPMPAEMQGVPPHWMPYFLVEDCDATTKTAESSGGMVLVPPRDIPNVGRFSVVRDPQGASFATFKPLPRQA